MKKLFFVLCALIVFVGLASAQTGVKKRRALPHEYGNVVMNNFSERAGMAPVLFNHWLHRAIYSCRLCHVDIAFNMKAGTTGVKAPDNARGYYCGACHNGKMLYKNKPVFESCSLKTTQEDLKRCERCHSVGKNSHMEYDFYAFTAKFPQERYGNGINWIEAEAAGKVHLIDYLEGISIKRKAMKVQKDFTLSSKVEGMADIIFSHEKHTKWNGCEVCHPEIFVGVKKGASKYSMVEIFDGKFCGVCHIKVAFPLLDCQRCHTKPV